MLPTSIIIGVALLVAINRDASRKTCTFLGICFGVSVAAGRFGGLVESINEAMGEAGNGLLQIAFDWFNSKRAAPPAAGFLVVAGRYNLGLVGIGR